MRIAQRFTTFCKGDASRYVPGGCLPQTLAAASSALAVRVEQFVLTLKQLTSPYAKCCSTLGGSTAACEFQSRRDD